MPIIKLDGLQKFSHLKQWASELPTLRSTALEQWFSTFWASGPGKRQISKLLSRSKILKVFGPRIMCFMDPKTPNRCQIYLNYSFSSA